MICLTRTISVSVRALRLVARMSSVPFMALGNFSYINFYCLTFADEFAYPQFDDPKHAGSRLEFDKAEFAKICNEEFEKGGRQLHDG